MRDRLQVHFDTIDDRFESLSESDSVRLFDAELVGRMAVAAEATHRQPPR